MNYIKRVVQFKLIIFREDDLNGNKKMYWYVVAVNENCNGKTVTFRMKLKNYCNLMDEGGGGWCVCKPNGYCNYRIPPFWGCGRGVLKIYYNPFVLLASSIHS